MLQVIAHHIKLRIGINKVTAARTQQHMYRQPTAAYSFTNQAMARRQPTFTERTAKLNTVRSSVTRDEACVDTLGTQFKDNLTHYKHTRLKATNTNIF